MIFDIRLQESSLYYYNDNVFYNFDVFYALHRKAYLAKSDFDLHIQFY